MEKRLAVIGILIENRIKAAPAVNRLIGEYGEMILGRIGLPYHDKGVGVISLVVEGDTDCIGAFTGKVGMLDGVRIKTMMLSKGELPPVERSI